MISGILRAAIACIFILHLITVRAQVPTAPVEGLRDNTPRVHALVHARIVPEPGKIIENGVVLIRDGIIAAVGSDIDIPADASGI